MRVSPLFICLALWFAGLSPTLSWGQVTAEQICAELSSAGGALPPSCTTLDQAEAPPAMPRIPAVTADGSLTLETQESHIFFTGGGTALDDAAQRQLGQLIAVLETPPLRDACLRLVGHSDASGGADINREIAAKRAETVATILRAGLLDPNRIAEVDSAGEDAPLLGLDAEAPQQRRVAIHARRCPTS